MALQRNIDWLVFNTNFSNISAILWHENILLYKETRWMNTWLNKFKDPLLLVLMTLVLNKWRLKYVLQYTDWPYPTGKHDK